MTTGHPWNPDDPGTGATERALQAVRKALRSSTAGRPSTREQRERIGLAGQVFLLSLRLHWKVRAAGAQGRATSAYTACGLRRHPP